jgi:hypothetical protein
MWLADWKRLKQERVKETEDCSVRAEAEGEGNNGGEGKCRSSREPAQVIKNFPGKHVSMLNHKVSAGTRRNFETE